MRSFWNTQHDISRLNAPTPPTLETEVHDLVNIYLAERQFHPTQTESLRMVSAFELATEVVSARHADRYARMELDRASWIEHTKRYDTAIATREEEIIACRQEAHRVKVENAALEESARNFDSRFQALESQYQSLEQKLRAELRAKDAARATVTRVSQQHGQELGELARRHQAEIDELERLHDVGTKRMLQDHEREMEAVRKFHTQRLSNLLLQHEEESECARLWHEQAVSDMQQGFHDREEGLRRDGAIREEGLKVEHAEELASLRQELERLKTDTSADRASQLAQDLENARSSHQQVVAQLRRERHELQFSKTASDAAITSLRQQVKERQERNTQLETFHVGPQDRIKSHLDRFHSSLPPDSQVSTPAFTPFTLPDDHSTRSTSVQSALPLSLGRLSSAVPSAPTPPMQEVVTPVEQVQRPSTSWVKPELLSPVSLAYEPSIQDRMEVDASLAGPLFAPNEDDDQQAHEHPSVVGDQLEVKEPLLHSEASPPKISTAPLADLFTPPTTSASTFTFPAGDLPSGPAIESAKAGPSRFSHPSPIKSKAIPAARQLRTSIDVKTEPRSQPRSSSTLDRGAADGPSTAGPSTQSSRPHSRPRGRPRKSTSAASTPAPLLPWEPLRRASSHRSETNTKAKVPHDGTFEVEAIVGEQQRKMSDGSMRTAYKVHWKGFPLDQESLVWADEIERDEGWDRMYAHFLARNSGDAKRQRFVRAHK